MGNREPLTAKCCFGHLGGTLGNRLFERLLELGWFEPREDNPKHYSLTRQGVEELIKFGVDPYPKR
jgi:hypothetical protein